MKKIAEKVRDKNSEILKQKEKEKQEKLEKLKRLEELESQLSSIEKQATEDGLETLESSIDKGISSATKGEKIFEISISDEEIEKDMIALEEEVAAEPIVAEKSPYEKLIELHEWIELPQYGFMYSVPNKKKNKEDFISWRDEWSQVLLDYAKVGTFHIIFVKRLLTEKPFSKFINRKNAINELAEGLVEKNLGKWIKKKEALRVYWKSIEEWCSVIESWALDHAIFDVIMIPDIRNSDQEFAQLPVEDLREIFKKIEKQGKADMVEIDKDSFGIKFKFS